jgi:hypothetical protein
MLETLMPCANGCARADGAPYAARHGRYCNRCWGRIDIPLGIAGELTHHLLGNALSSSGSTDDRVDTSKDAPVPFNQAAFDDANELYAGIVHTVAVWAVNLGQQAPQIDAWRNERGTAVGLPTGLTPKAAGNVVAALATWIRVRLDDILDSAHRDDIEALTETVGEFWKMNARWPRVERADYSSMPCPIEDCKRRIAVYPPAFAGDTRRIVCTAGHWFPEEEYEHLILVFQQQAKGQKKTNRVAAHLAKKFGIGATA